MKEQWVQQTPVVLHPLDLRKPLRTPVVQGQKAKYPQLTIVVLASLPRTTLVGELDGFQKY
jgi:hypothetical protein